MAEYKDMGSSPPARIPKLQLIVEQPSTGGHWSPPKKKMSHVQKQRGSHSKTVIKSNTIPTGWVTDRLDNNNIKEAFKLL